MTSDAPTESESTEPEFTAPESTAPGSTAPESTEPVDRPDWRDLPDWRDVVELGDPTALDDLRFWLDEARDRGFLGPGEIEPHLRHAAGFARALLETLGAPPATLLDLGSGGGVPGLVLAAWWPTARVVLLDAGLKRTVFLEEAVEDLGWDDRIEVVRARSEDAAREPRWRGAFQAVTARSFGPPPVVAECAAGFLAVGGRLVVSEPPETHGERWQAPAALADLGLVVDGSPRYGMQVLEQTAPCPDRYPRRVGIPAKRPLF